MDRRGSLKCEDSNSKNTKLCQGDLMLCPKHKQLRFEGDGVHSTRNVANGNDLWKTNEPVTTSNESIRFVEKNTVAVKC